MVKGRVCTNIMDERRFQDLGCAPPKMCFLKIKLDRKLISHATKIIF